MNFISINGCKLLHIIVLLISTAWASEREPNLFKLGIELQEGTRLCAWADGCVFESIRSSIPILFGHKSMRINVALNKFDSTSSFLFFSS